MQPYSGYACQVQSQSRHVEFRLRSRSPLVLEYEQNLSPNYGTLPYDTHFYTSGLTNEARSISTLHLLEF